VPSRLAERGADTYDGDGEISNAERMSCELEKIAAALDRLHECPARYGICEDTGRLNPFGRIEISPWARTGVRAAERSGLPTTNFWERRHN
jgi:RNA polymerase-binding transcription factor DksA